MKYPKPKVFKPSEQKVQQELNVDYLVQCNLMTPEERINKGFELSEWAMMTNKHIESEIKKRILNVYCLL
jgi:hypothetical protein